MFHSISWQAYAVALAFTLTGYYVAVFLLFFRKDVSLLLVKQREGTSTSHPVKDGSTHLQQMQLFDTASQDPFTVPEEGTEEHLIYSCIDEVNAFFQEAKRRKCVKEELLYSLTSLLGKYPVLKESSYKVSITHVIQSECEHLCSLHLSADDLASMWIGR